MRADWIKCIEEKEPYSICGYGENEWMFTNLQHVINNFQSGGRLMPCPVCYALLMAEYLDRETCLEIRNEFGPREDDTLDDSEFGKIAKAIGDSMFELPHEDDPNIKTLRWHREHRMETPSELLKTIGKLDLEE